MGRSINRTGPWVLENNLDLTGLIGRLNKLLTPGKPIQVIETDTWKMPRLMAEPYQADVSTRESVSISPDAKYLHIPFDGPRIVVRTEPLEWNGNHYPTVIDIKGDFIVVSIPYLFKEKPDRVDVHEYIIVTHDND